MLFRYASRRSFAPFEYGRAYFADISLSAYDEVSLAAVSPSGRNPKRRIGCDRLHAEDRAIQQKLFSETYENRNEISIVANRCSFLQRVERSSLGWCGF